MSYEFKSFLKLNTQHFTSTAASGAHFPHHVHALESLWISDAYALAPCDVEGDSCRLCGA